MEAVREESLFQVEPYALDRVPAGSSGGTAAAVAANFGAVGLGTDTGNSPALEYYNGSAWVSASSGITMAAGATSVLVRTPVTNDLLDEARDVTGAGTRLILTGRPVPLDPGVELAAYRIVQEALTNVRRHAGAAHARVLLRFHEDALHVEAQKMNGGAVFGHHRQQGFSGGIAVLRGNLAPDGAIIKPAAMEPKFYKHQGRAVVFKDYNDMNARLDDPNLDVTADSVIVLQSGGPVGAPGMPEWGMLPIPKKLLEQGVRDMLRDAPGRAIIARARAGGESDERLLPDYPTPFLDSRGIMPHQYQYATA
mgnify:CR=1 FL=1